MNTLWIVHRDSALRAMLGRLAAGYRIVAGSPASALFTEAGEPAAVLLGVSPEPAAEIVFAQRVQARFPRAGWVLLHDRSISRREVTRLFAGLGAEVLPCPPRARSLEAALARLSTTGATEPLDERAAREQLLQRGERYFEGTQVLDAIDEPDPIWARGEPGTGRLLLARIAQVRSRAAFLHYPCDEHTRLDELGERICALMAQGEGSKGLVICLEGVERLPTTVQRELRGWIELGPPLSGLAATRLRWILLSDDGPPHALLEPELADACSGGEIRLPPLRERPGAAHRFALATLAAGEEDAAPRQLPPEVIARIDQDPWPGNHAELERRLLRALRSGSGPITTQELGLAWHPAEEEILREPPAPPSPGRPEGGTRPPAALPPLDRDGLRHVFQALAHELRNPLVSVRTFASLLPERWEDASFRSEFREQVERDVGRLESRLDRISRFAALRPASGETVDVSAILLELLEARRSAIEERRLLVLRELETERPFARGDAAALRFAFESLLDVALDWSGERADLYLASRHHPTGLGGRPAMRVLLRFHGGGEPADLAAAGGTLSRREISLDLQLADEVVRAMDGIFTLDANADETVILVDLPGPME